MDSFFDAPIGKLVINTQTGVEFVNMDEVIRAEAAQKHSLFFLEDGSNILSQKQLKHYEQLLEQFAFCRIHKSHLINLRHIKTMSKQGNGQVIMSDGTTIDIARRKKKYFLEKMKDIAF